MADFLDRSDFDAIETRPLRTLPVIGADGGDARIYELQLPNGRVRISLSAPTPRILEDVANSTFGAELVELPNTLMSSVTGQVAATSLRAAAEEDDVHRPALGGQRPLVGDGEVEHPGVEVLHRRQVAHVQTDVIDGKPGGRSWSMVRLAHGQSPI